MAKTEWSGIGNEYTVKLTDGETLRVKTILADAVRWERIMKRPFIGGDTAPGFTGVATLLWIALRRTGQIDSRDREGWILKVEDFGVDADEDDEGSDSEDDGEGGSDPLG